MGMVRSFSAKTGIKKSDLLSVTFPRISVVLFDALYISSL